MSSLDPSSIQLVDVTLANGVIAKGLQVVLTEGTSKQLPIVVDFQSPKLKHRLKNGADGELIVKALGMKRSDRAGVLIYDFTAGLGTEAFVLASAGFTVVAFERDPGIFALLEDGIRRWRQQNGDALKLEFRQGDATKLVPQAMADGSLSRAFAVMLDPMFEGDAVEGKSLPKKEMATLRRMLQPTSDTELATMFEVAQAAATGRVIVKRPQGAPDLVSVDAHGRAIKPARRVEGKTARYDIYSCR